VPGRTRTEVTGNPVRPEIQTLAGLAYLPPDAEVRLLVLGGSLGARVFSDVVPPALTRLPDALLGRLRVTQQCRPEDLARVRTAYDATGIAAELAPFFPDVAHRLARAHLVIARAGASTVAELAMAGRPAILVPLPEAIDNHQDANARALAETGGAWVMPQAGFTAESLAARLSTLLSDPAALDAAAAAARTAARPDAAVRLADLVEAQMYQEVRP
jgi:UDP-N-acetylglucosamine--N-acetylmuramyl-(pentapeptide) pyrophosphoryl-undecaprenol N-acetylglucosamine transferase